MSKTIFFLAAISAFVVSIFMISMVSAASGSNLVKVSACQQVGADIQVTKSGKTYTLTSACRNAGHGMRQYTLTCTSATQYKVEWHDGCGEVGPAASYYDGKPIKKIGDSRIWYVSGGVLHEFKGSAVYKSYFPDFSDIVSISTAQFNDLKMVEGTPVCYQGGKLITFSQNTTQAYSSSPNCVLHSVNQGWLEKWYGANWSQSVIADNQLKSYYTQYGKFGASYGLDSAPAASGSGVVWF